MCWGNSLILSDTSLAVHHTLWKKCLMFSQVSSLAILIPMISEFKNCHQPELVTYSICVCNFFIICSYKSMCVFSSLVHVSVWGNVPMLNRSCSQEAYSLFVSIAVCINWFHLWSNCVHLLCAILQRHFTIFLALNTYSLVIMLYNLSSMHSFYHLVRELVIKYMFEFPTCLWIPELCWP